MTPAVAALDALNLACYLSTWFAALAWGMGALALHYFVGSEVFELGSDARALRNASPDLHAMPVATTPPASKRTQIRVPCGPSEKSTRRELGRACCQAARASQGVTRVQGLGPVMVRKVRQVGAPVKPTHDIPARPVCHTPSYDWTRAHGMANALGGWYVTD